MEHLLSIGLNFEMCHVALETLRKREPWLYKMKRLMFLPSKSPEQPLQLTGGVSLASGFRGTLSGTNCDSFFGR